jgi:hypothetical protein
MHALHASHGHAAGHVFSWAIEPSSGIGDAGAIPAIYLATGPGKEILLRIQSPVYHWMVFLILFW